ncbi:hypothetical protein OQX61_03975 [Pedobacter sp. PLR]|uniref:hypothetical protein n=1 Tax=Pedobacter sp. PLR TaxID=2994465 RepID=UPI0022476C56|nr:hypothetical protein [Pedobacter sp. PLR]MCX2450423.1 hypothetical protein [Pedobacter sp. PLR]
MNTSRRSDDNYAAAELQLKTAEIPEKSSISAWPILIVDNVFDIPKENKKIRWLEDPEVRY